MPATPALGASGLGAADWLEVRADCADAFEPWAVERFGVPAIYALRSRAEGGRHDGDAASRVERLAAAAERFALVELEAERDLIPELLDLIPPERRLIAWHGPAENADALARRFDRYRHVPAAYYKLVPHAAAAADALAPLLFAHRANRGDVIAHASGPAGSWTRVLAPRYGAPVIYGNVGEHPDEDGLDIDALVADYGLPALPDVREIFGIVGTAVARSLSPRLHNAAYRAAGRPALYFSFHAESLEDFMSAMDCGEGLGELGLRFGGATVAAPHKEAALQLACHASPVARACRSANNIARGADGWHAGTTDPAGVLIPLLRRGVDPASRRALVVGCGGAGRAVAAALVAAGADVLLMNRGEQRARFASDLIGVPYVPLADVDLERFDIVVNATPVGRREGEQPFGLRGARTAAVVIDLVYGTAPTSLVSAARSLGATAVDGCEVLRAQVYEQYRMLTGTAMPSHVMNEILGREPDLGVPLQAMFAA